MLTYLDWYVSGYTESLRRVLSLMGGEPNVMCRQMFGRRLDPMSDLEALGAKLRLTLSSMGGSGAIPRGMYDADDHEGNLASFENFLLPFALLPDDVRAGAARIGEAVPAMFRTVAVQPSADLVAALARAKPPAGQEEAVRKEFAAATWFVDLPHGAILVGDLGVRALFVQPSPTLGTVAVCAVLTVPGSNRTAGRLMWLLGDRVGEVSGLVDGDVDRRLLQDEAEDFLALLVLYRLHADKAQRATLPRLTREQATSRKARQHHKRASLFSVESLAPPADRFGRARATGQGGWKLGWRSDVAGHFKTQPWGPHASLRKLIFVEGYTRGPEGAPKRHKLERLDAPECRRSRFPVPVALGP